MRAQLLLSAIWPTEREFLKSKQAHNTSNTTHLNRVRHILWTSPPMSSTDEIA